jgi:hypothetical protein
MTNEEFNSALERAKLSKKKFAELVGADYKAVYNWSNEGRGVPYWVPSWIENYLKSEAYTLIKEEVFSIEGVTIQS